MNLLQNLKEGIANLFGRKKSETKRERFDTGKFLALVAEFEIKIKEELQFELLQLYYAPYSFGSGHVVYKIKGRNVQITFDGRDNALGMSPIEVRYSKPHAKFPSDGWEQTQTYSVDAFWDEGIKEILEKSKARR